MPRPIINTNTRPDTPKYSVERADFCSCRKSKYGLSGVRPTERASCSMFRKNRILLAKSIEIASSETVAMKPMKRH